MTARHFTERKPKRARFAWGRKISDQGVVVYRLFRRDSTGKLHRSMYPMEYLPHAERRQIARDLKRERRILRDRVDEIDLAAMGVIDG